MNTYIAILRGINVSGKNIIKMDALKDLFVNSAYKNVQTYIQSGNIIFGTDIYQNYIIEENIRTSIAHQFGFDVPVIVLKADELKRIINDNPFLKDENIETQYLHVTFLSDIPDHEKIDRLRDGEYGSDKFVYLEQTIYLYCPGGYGKTKLTNTMLESKLKVNATTRNWKTVNELLKMAENLINT
ncbi:MAG: DUF1697 domain-containing protein [Saprospiraceae bacterium]|nr:DUF1697 domain-containing protein [Saprospiraceae bacterium]